MEGARVLVAGASGMVGAGVLRCLLGRHPQARLRAVYHNSQGPPLEDPRVEWVRADLRLQADCRRVSAGCDAAVMAAANSCGSRQMAAEPWRPVTDNVIMNTQMLDAFHHTGVGRIVFIGSSTVYQPFEGATREDQLDLSQDPPQAYHGVGWGMRFVEQLCRFWHDKAGLDIVLVRAANVFGPFAAFDPQRSNVVPALIRKAVARMDPFEIWGSPDVVRDVIYVDDLARAVVGLLGAPRQGFDVFNVGSAEATTVGQIAHHALTSAGHSPSEIAYGTASGPARSRVLDCSKINRQLGWTVQHSVAEGIDRTTAWWVANQERWTR